MRKTQADMIDDKAANTKQVMGWLQQAAEAGKGGVAVAERL